MKKQVDWQAVAKNLPDQGYFRSLDEVAQTDEHKAWLEDEFPYRSSIPDIDRRTMLKLIGASAALAGAAGCRNLPQTKLIPHAKEPENRTPGVRLQFATSMPFAGYGFPVLVDSVEGRPIKVEGNDQHPWSGGACHPYVQADLLSMYDPDRLRAPEHDGLVSTWEAFLEEWRAALAGKKATGGLGVAILIGRNSSPTLASVLGKFKAAYPKAQVFEFEAVNDDNEQQAIAGYTPIYDFASAGVVLSLDGDFLASNPHTVKYAADFSAKRDPALGSQMIRLYSVESSPSNTGVFSDHRWAVKPSEVYGAACAIANAMGVSTGSGAAPKSMEKAVAAIAEDLRAHGGVVYVGAHQPPAVHAVAHAINVAIQAPVRYVPVNHGSCRVAIEAFSNGAWDTVLVCGGNPVYDAPKSKVADAIKRAKRSAFLGSHKNETAEHCKWVLPESHWLEAWGDQSSPDGTVTVQQPLIEPLFDSKSALETVMGLMRDSRDTEAVDRASHPGLATDKVWEKALSDGFVAFPVPLGAKPAVASVPGVNPGAGIEAIVIPDPSTYDGRYANNGWLQELPRPLTKLTWDNAVQMSPNTAKQLGVSEEELVSVSGNGVTVKAPVYVQVGHADGCVTLLMGGGRTKGGRTLEHTGFDFMGLNMPGGFATVDIKSAGGTYALASTQVHHSMEGRDIVREGTVASMVANPALHPHEFHEMKIEGLYNLTEEMAAASPELPQWAMTIDLNYCVGCNACVTACQAENNIPTVGKAEVSRGRELHWIRVDRYYRVSNRVEHPDIETGIMGSSGFLGKFEGAKHTTSSGPIEDDAALDPNRITTVYQPLPCMHCELAPCEPVCPVAATTHSHEGLNQMVYNRCVGTRYCSNNCPYKVRRFNYYNYQHGQIDYGFKNNDKREGDDNSPIGKKYGNSNFRGEEDVPLLRLINNPDVTVRGRGVMEKCTYCVQRINHARIKSKKEKRDIKDGEIVTACQQACPTKAIMFGNMADAKSAVSMKRMDKRNYSLLEDIGTKPRTTYLGRVRNPNPLLEVSA